MFDTRLAERFLRITIWTESKAKFEVSWCIESDFRKLAVCAVVDEYPRKRSAGEARAADWLVEQSGLSHGKKPTLKFRVLEVGGGFGLQHRWMYDAASMSAAMTGVGFEIVADNETPSRTYRENYGSVHLVGRVP